MKKVTNTHPLTQNTTKIYWSSFFVVPLFIFLMVITQCEDPQQEEEPWPWYLKRVTYTVTFVDAFTGEPLANRDVCIGRSFQAVFGIECDTLKKTDDQGQLSGVMLMEVGHAIGFTLPYLGLLSGYNIATPEGRDYIWEYQKSGVENYNLNQEFKIRFHEIGAVNDNASIDWEYDIEMKVTPNGWVWVQADWVPENFNLLIKPLPWDTLLQGPSNAGPHAYSIGTPINLLPNRFVELKIYLASLTDSTNISVISDTSFYVKKDSIIGTSQKRDLPDFTLTINKPKEQENETNME